MPKTWTTGELVTATNFNLLPRVLYRDVLASATGTVTIADADITGSLADWETLKLTVQGESDNASSTFRNLILRLNGDGAANYVGQMVYTSGDGVQVSAFDDTHATSLRVGHIGTSTALTHVAATIIGHSRSDRRTVVHSVGHASVGSADDQHRLFQASGRWAGSAVVTSISALVGTDNFNAGTLIMLEGVMRREP